ncbi:MAG: DUF2157 domain-containing protein [Deltaproteobacteria bacterium]|nr:DUF2157 domain-containing protein [Deltaproteobacteria bacterium]
MRLIRLLKNDIAREASEWVSEDIITQSQAEKICRRYGVDYDQVKNRSLGYNVLVALGYLFIGLAVITLIGANWDNIPRAVRMWGLIVLTVGTQGIALRKYLSREKSAATGVFLLGNLFYGASIILIAQIYHLGEHMPDGVFWWATGCLPIAILINSPWIALQSTLLGMLWFYLELDMGFYPALFPLFILGALLVLYRGKQSIGLFLTAVASIGFWVEYSLAEYWRQGNYYSFHAEHLPVSAALFIFAYMFSHWLKGRQSVVAKDYAAVLAVWTLRFGLILMFIMSFEQPWRRLIRANWEHTMSMWIIIAVISGFSLFLAYKAERINRAIYIMPFYLISIIAVLVSGNRDHAVYFQIIYNLALITTGIWLILRGIQNGMSHYFFLGVLSILLTAFMRYIDLIGDYIGGALLFMVCAIVLLGAAKYWKNYEPGREAA